MKWGRWGFLAILVSILGTVAVQAQVYIWTDGSGDGNWSNASNWQGGVVANGSTAIVEFAGAGETVNVDGSYTVETLDFSTSTSSYTLNVSGSLNASGVDGGSYDPNINVVGGGSFDNTGNSFSAGNLTVSAAGSLTLNAVTESGATLSASNLTVADSGTLSLGTNTTFSAATLVLGTGSILSEGSGSTLSALTFTAGSSVELSLSDPSAFAASGTYELLDWNSGTINDSQFDLVSNLDGALQLSGDDLELDIDLVPEPPTALLLALGLAVLLAGYWLGGAGGFSGGVVAAGTGAAAPTGCQSVRLSIRE